MGQLSEWLIGQLVHNVLAGVPRGHIPRRQVDGTIGHVVELCFMRGNMRIYPLDRSWCVVLYAILFLLYVAQHRMVSIAERC